jgi:penicillin amidase
VTPSDDAHPGSEPVRSADDAHPGSEPVRSGENARPDAHPANTHWLLRTANLSIAVLLFAVLVAGYWYGWRPLPQTSGQVSAPIAAEARIVRDALGVPHIQAASVEDAIFLEGLAMAQDRLWQMDALRRRAAGELAEVVGAQALASDEEARRMGLQRIADAQQRSARPEERAVLAAFARGVNFFIETHRGRLPLEFALLNYDPRPWTVADCWLAGLEMYRTLTTNWRTELLKASMLASGDRAKVEFLFPPAGGSDPQPGSNAWAIGGARSATGKPILSNDPHLEFSLPSPWYLVALKAPGLDVTGASIIALPGVVLGHNGRIAWGITNLEFDVQDLYREKIDLRTGRYQAGDKVAQAQPERDAISVKGARPVVLTNWVTRHGPLLAGDRESQYALRWTASETGGLTFPFLALDRAQDWTQFRAALEGYGGPGLNFVYADSAGNIGSQVAGRLPVRKTCAGDTPSDGTGQECEWAGFIPFEQLPQSFNPESGVIVSANQNPFPAGFADPVTGNFASLYRAAQIRSLLNAKTKWRAEDMLTVQTDVYSAFDRFLAQQIVAAFDAQKTKPVNLADAVDTLRQWNGRMEKDAAAPMVVSLVYDQLRNLMGERAAVGFGNAYQTRNAPRVVERLLRERPQDWFPDYDALLLRCLTGAFETGRKLQGSKASRWDYGQYRALRIDSPVAGRMPLLGRYFNIGPIPMSGAPTTVMQRTGGLGPSLRMTVDLGDLEHSFANLVTGESGQRFSSHYKDQWEAYYAGRSFPMPFSRVDAKEILRVTPQ